MSSPEWDELIAACVRVARAHEARATDSSVKAMKALVEEVRALLKVATRYDRRQERQVRERLRDWHAKTFPGKRNPFERRRAK